MIPPCAVMFTRTLPYIYSYTADKGCTDSDMLCALLRLRGEARALKLEKKASMKRLFWLLMGFGKNKSCYEVIAYVCSGKIVPCRQCSSIDKRWS